jgi:hypothetical protein
MSGRNASDCFIEPSLQQVDAMLAPLGQHSGTSPETRFGLVYTQHRHIAVGEWGGNLNVERASREVEGELNVELIETNEARS